MFDKEKMYLNPRYCKCGHTFDRHKNNPATQGKDSPEICKDCDCLGFEQFNNLPVSLWKHPLLKECAEVTDAIEACGASLQLTAAVVKSSTLLQNLQIILMRLNGLPKGGM
jgi:hypothetical protein